MSNQGRALISSLNAGDYSAVDQYKSLTDHDIKIINHHIHELLERSIRTENFKLFRAILRIPEVSVSTPQYCAIRHATRSGLVEFVSDLARVPTANPNLADADGKTALIHACSGRWSQQKALDLARAILMADDTRVNIRDKKGKTALHYAMDTAWYEVADLLMGQGAHPKIEDNEESTALGMAMQAIGQIPDDLWQGMLNHNAPIPEEEADHAVDPVPSPDPQDDLQQQNAAPGVNVQSYLNDPAPLSQPQVQQVQSVVKDSLSDAAASASDPASALPSDPGGTGTTTAKAPVTARKQQPDDKADLQTVMGGQPLDDSLEKDYLFSPAQDGPSYRLHRKAVLEHIADVQTALQNQGESINSADCRRTDPSTGLNLWHVAARYGLIVEVLNVLVANKEWPEAADFAARTDDGLTVGAELESSSHSHQTLNDPIWIRRPQLLAAILASLTENGKRSFARLITRVNLMILNQS